MSQAWVEPVRSLLEAPAPAVLTTYRKNGGAHTVPVWYRWTGEAFEVVIASGPPEEVISGGPNVGGRRDGSPCDVRERRRADHHPAPLAAISYLVKANRAVCWLPSSSLSLKVPLLVANDLSVFQT
jgi:hypothetical protein